MKWNQIKTTQIKSIKRYEIKSKQTKSKCTTKNFITRYVDDRKLAVSVSCVLCLRSAFCVMLGARTMLGTMENMEFINIY